MGAGAVGRALAFVLALAPALAWYVTPEAPVAAVAVGSLAIAAALHGLGRAVGALIDDREAPPALAIALGVAAYLALGSALAGAGLFDRIGQRLVMVAGTAIGAAWIAARTGAAWSRLGRSRPSPITVVSVMASVLVALLVLGHVGAWHGRFFDGSVYHLGAVSRLHATGGLGDAISVPRDAGLGGNVLLSSLVAVYDDVRAIHAIDRGLGFALALALLLGGVRRGPMRAAIGFALVVLAAALPEFEHDVGSRWITVALVCALYQTITRAHIVGSVPWAAVLLGGALATLHHGGFAAALVAVVHAARCAPAGSRGRVAAAGAAIILVVAGGLIVAALTAGTRDPGPTPALVGLVPRLAMWAAAALVAHALAAIVVRDLHDGSLAVTAAAACAAAALGGAVSPAIAVAWQVVQPLGVALLLLLVSALLTPSVAARGVRPAVATALVLVTLGLATTRFPIGRPARSTERRLGQLVETGRAFATGGFAPDGTERAAYAAVLASIPPGARVGVWVDRPDLLAYRRHDVIDLRSGTASCIERASWQAALSPAPASCRRLSRRLSATDLDYLLVSSTLVPHRHGVACRILTGRRCVDPLMQLVEGRVPVASTAGLTVFAVADSGRGAR